MNYIPQKILSIKKVSAKNPVFLKKCLHLNEVLEHRHFDCGYYDECLTEAMNSKAMSFSCSRCSFFKNGADKKPHIPEEAVGFR